MNARLATNASPSREVPAPGDDARPADPRRSGTRRPAVPEPAASAASPTHTKEHSHTMPAPKNTPLDRLESLSPEERDQLRRALDGEVVQVDAEQRAMQRQRLLAELLDPRDHFRNCPRIGAQEPRVEAFGVTAAADPAARLPERPVTIVRCIECAGQAVIQESYAAVSQRVAAEVAALNAKAAG